MSQGKPEGNGSHIRWAHSWLCLTDGGDYTKGVMFQPIPKKSGQYRPGGPKPSADEDKPELTPEEKKQCKADRTALREARVEKRTSKAALKAAREALKAARAEFIADRDAVKELKAKLTKC